jgi:hypothetical protein
MMGMFVVWSTLLWGMSEVTVSPLAGPSVRGELVRLGADELELGQPDTSQTFRFDQLRRVEISAASPASPAGPIQVWLTDGSVLRGTAYTVSNSQATLRGEGELEWKIPTRAVARVLFRDHVGDEELRRRWEELTAARADQDTLIYRRETDDMVVLDSLQGVLYDVREEGVDFLFDGERISPRRERIEGLVYFHPASSAQPPPTLCVVEDRSGSRWQAGRLRWAGEQLEVETVAGVEVEFPLDELRYLDFTAGNLVYLSDLEPESVSWRPFVESRITPGLLEARYAPRRDQGFGGGPIRILGQSYEKGLALRSYTTLVYRVGSEFRRFQARIGMDDLARNSAVRPSLQFTVSGDDQVLWEGVIRGADDPLDLDLEMTGVRRLKITVDFGDDLDIADFLNLADARFTK